MYPSISDSRLTVGQALARLMQQHGPDKPSLYKALQTSSSTYLKIERDQRELSLLMALRVCQFYKLDLHEFVSMLSDEELRRQDYAVIRVQQQRERKKAEAAKAKVIDIKTEGRIPEARL
jgi:transcriptional regulator with XRE-family HTH domain